MLRTTIAVLYSALCLAISCATGVLAANEQRPPSVLIILTDDQGYGDLGCYGATDVLTPHIDSLAYDGALFSAHYTSPVCTPTRAALLTGSHPVRLDMDRVLYTQRDRKGLNPDETTIAEIARSKGYRTGATGKWHLGGLLELQPPAHGFDDWFGHPSGHNHGRVGYYQRLLFPEKKYPIKFQTLKLYENGELIEEEPLPDLLTERFTQRAVQFIEQTPADQPFLYYFAHIMPHVPVVTHKKFAGVSPRGTRYGDSIHEIDDSVGQLLDALERTGRSNDTLVLYLSDNGGTNGYGPEESGDNGPLRGWKGSVWEGGIRTPALARLPGVIEPGLRINEPVHVTDWFSTIVDLIDGEMPAVTVDGHNLLPHFSGTPWPENREILHTNRNKPQAIRIGRYKFVELIQRDKATKEIISQQSYLFDLVNDYGERFNIAHKHPERVAAMRERMHEKYNAMKAAVRPAFKKAKE